uniref:Uncharacterized protein n=1 Tax=viral metagenome TaxID=1070528 RepID=A0A6M3IKP1_9ZZZZ
MEMLIQIKAPHFVAGVVTHNVKADGYDNKCAPIVKYMKHWKPFKIKCYCQGKGWDYNAITL